LYRRLGGPQGRSGRVRKTLSPRSESLSRAKKKKKKGKKKKKKIGEK
jgi:hypothetical protein